LLIFVLKDGPSEGRMMAAKKIPRGGRTDSKTSQEGKPLSDSHKLDQALDDSFPGSDPVSLTQPTGRSDTQPKPKD
jgi:hypothetical protein